MSARDRIMGRLSQTASAVSPPLPNVQHWVDSQRKSESTAQQISRLKDALEASHAEVYLTTPNGWTDVLARIIAAKAIRNLLVGGNIQSLDLPDGTQLIRYTHAIEHWKRQMFDSIDAGLTHSKCAIAATGTLVLWPDANEPRLMSLVPPIHIALLDADKIHPDFSTALQAENWENTLPTNALLISGPSKTADIQQTLAYGAHGPRELIVLILQADGAKP